MIMRKVVGILFLFLTISSTEVVQLLKLPILFHHYAAHKTEKKGVSFIGFLSEHYSYSHDNDNDVEEDMKLPFQAVYKELLSTLCLPLHFYTYSYLPVLVKNDYIDKYPNCELSACIQDIFHPPKNWSTISAKMI